MVATFPLRQDCDLTSIPNGVAFVLLEGHAGKFLLHETKSDVLLSGGQLIPLHLISSQRS